MKTSERTYRTFKSWDEVSPGDTLYWVREGKYRGTTVEFISVSDFPGSTLNAKLVEIPEGEDPEDYPDDGWSSCKYPFDLGLYCVGWVLQGEYATFKYDPTQQPEDDSI